MRRGSERGTVRRGVGFFALVAVVGLIALVIAAGSASGAPARTASPDSIGNELAWVGDFSAVPTPGPDGWHDFWVTPSVELHKVIVFNAEHAWVTASDGSLYAWDGTGWRINHLDDDLGAMAAVDLRHVWVASDEAIHFFDGSRWTATSVGDTTALAAADVTHAWATTASGILRWDGHGWSHVYASGAAQLLGVTAAGPGRAWAVGTLADGSGVILAWDGARWTQQATVPQPLSAVYAADARHAWAVSSEGSIYAWDGTGWSLSADLHLVLRDVSGTDASHVWAVSESGEVLFYNGASWRVEYRAPTSLVSIAPLDPTHVWAVGFDAVYATQGS
jgi:hypothetical protein